MKIDAYCGLRCEGCEFIASHGCGGCVATKGNPFHGKCPIAACCIEKGLAHCGLCPDFPCKPLNDYAFDPEYDENGARLEQLKRWANGEE